MNRGTIRWKKYPPFLLKLMGIKLDFDGGRIHYDFSLFYENLPKNMNLIEYLHSWRGKNRVLVFFPNGEMASRLGKKNLRVASKGKSKKMATRKVKSGIELKSPYPQCKTVRTWKISLARHEYLVNKRFCVLNCDVIKK